MGRPKKASDYAAVEDFVLTADQALAGLNRAIDRITDRQYRAFIDGLMKLGPEQVEIVEIDDKGKRRKLPPEKYPCMDGAR